MNVHSAADIEQSTLARHLRVFAALELLAHTKSVVGVVGRARCAQPATAAAPTSISAQVDGSGAGETGTPVPRSAISHAPRPGECKVQQPSSYQPPPRETPAVMGLN